MLHFCSKFVSSSSFKSLAVILAIVVGFIAPCAAFSGTVNTQVLMSGGQTIHVDVYAATTPGVHPAVVFLYGTDAMAILPWTYTALGGWFAAQGYNFYIVHYFDRTHTVYGDPVSDVVNFQVWADTVHDATTWVAAQPGVDAQRIGIMGMSLGSFLAIYQAGHDTRIKALADWYGAVVDPTVTFMPPTLILQGGVDPIVPVASAYKLQTLVQGLNSACELHLYPADGHGFSLTDEFDAISRTLAFFGQYLGK